MIDDQDTLDGADELQTIEAAEDFGPRKHVVDEALVTVCLEALGYELPKAKEQAEQLLTPACAITLDSPDQMVVLFDHNRGVSVSNRKGSEVYRALCEFHRPRMLLAGTAAQAQDYLFNLGKSGAYHTRSVDLSPYLASDTLRYQSSLLRDGRGSNEIRSTYDIQTTRQAHDRAGQPVHFVTSHTSGKRYTQIAYTGAEIEAIRTYLAKSYDCSLLSVSKPMGLAPAGFIHPAALLAFLSAAQCVTGKVPVTAEPPDDTTDAPEIDNSWLLSSLAESLRLSDPYLDEDAYLARNSWGATTLADREQMHRELAHLFPGADLNSSMNTFWTQIQGTTLRVLPHMGTHLSGSFRESLAEVGYRIVRQDLTLDTEWRQFLGSWPLITPGRVSRINRRNWYRESHTDADRLQDMFRQEWLLVYDPKHTRKYLKQRNSTRVRKLAPAKPPVVMAIDVYQLMYDIERPITIQLGGLYTPNKLGSAIHRLQYALQVLVLEFGPYAYRQLPGFTSFLKSVSVNKEASLKKLAVADESFAEWVAAELKSQTNRTLMRHSDRHKTLVSRRRQPW